MSTAQKPSTSTRKSPQQRARPFGRQINIRLSSEDYAALQEAAKREKIAVGEFARRAIWMRLAGKGASDMIAQAIEVERRTLRSERDAIHSLLLSSDTLMQRLEAVDGQVQAVRSGINNKLIPYLDGRFGTLQKALSLSGYLHTTEEQG